MLPLSEKFPAELSSDVYGRVLDGQVGRGGGGGGGGQLVNKRVRESGGRSDDLMRNTPVSGSRVRRYMLVVHVRFYLCDSQAYKRLEVNFVCE